MKIYEGENHFIIIEQVHGLKISNKKKEIQKKKKISSKILKSWAVHIYKYLELSYKFCRTSAVILSKLNPKRFAYQNQRWIKIFARNHYAY